uniref:histone acetyltransferase n=1 Tax=Caenorhabditis tropicalis TaxID=1561998 RepID=A0A1I7V3S1_9PELO
MPAARRQRAGRATQSNLKKSSKKNEKKKVQSTGKRTFSEFQHKKLYEVLNESSWPDKEVQIKLATDIGLTLRQNAVNNEELTLADKENAAPDQNGNGTEPMEVDETDSQVEEPMEDVFLMESTSGSSNQEIISEIGPFESLVAGLKKYLDKDAKDKFLERYFKTLVETSKSNKEWFNGTSSGTTIISKMRKYFTDTYSSWQWQSVKPIMKEAGYCCGDALQYKKTFSRCDADPTSCLIQNTSWTFFDKESGQTLNFCEFHHKNLNYPVTIKGVVLKKKPRMKPTDLPKEEEDLIECSECRLYFHKSCRDAGQVPNRKCSCNQTVLFSPNQLAISNCSAHMEQMLLDWDTDEETRGIAKRITIRVVSSSKSLETIPEGDKIRDFYGIFGRTVPERISNQRTILAFYQKDGRDILVLAMLAKEYGVGCAVHSGKVVLDMLDTVQFIDPPSSRSKIYRRIIDSYFSYTKSIGFRRVHWWAANPRNQEHDYLFNCHPENQKYAELDKLCNWYKKLVSESETIESKENRVLKMEDIERRDFSFFDDLFINGGYYDKLVTGEHAGIFSSKKSTAEKLEQFRKELTGVKESKSNKKPEKPKENDIFNLDFFKNEEDRGELFINDADPELRSRIAATAETWLTVQRVNRFEFSDEARAISSTSALIKMLIDEQTVPN